MIFTIIVLINRYINRQAEKSDSELDQPIQPEPKVAVS